MAEVVIASNASAEAIGLLLQSNCISALVARMTTAGFVVGIHGVTIATLYVK